jgi:hypothetical protein
MVRSDNPVGAFVSYAHADQPWLERFRRAVEPLQTARVLRLWFDHALMPGDDWHPELMRRIDEADFIVLLVTPAFLSSRFCFGKEMRRGLARHDAGLARVIPILLEPCEWGTAPFSRVQGLPRGMHPVSESSDQDGVLSGIAEDLRSLALQIRSSFVTQPSHNELTLFTDAQLMTMMENVKRTMAVIQNVIAAYPHGQQPVDKLIELDDLQRRLHSYEIEFNRRLDS